IVRAIDLAHAAGGQEAADLVPAQTRPRLERALGTGDAKAERGGVSKTAGVLVRFEQPFDVAAQLRIVRTPLGQKCRAMAGFLLQSRLEQLGEPLPALGRHAGSWGGGEPCVRR